MRIGFHPPFETAAAFADQYWRAAHYLGAVGAGVESIEFRTDLPAPTAPPDYLDPSLSARAASFIAKVNLRSAGAAAAYDIVILWDQTRVGDAPPARECVVLDPAMLHEGDLWIELGARLSRDEAPARADMHARLNTALAKARAEVVNLFGSGPSLGAANLGTAQGGVNVVCNSLVANQPLMEKLRPVFIVAVDPIFHAGASRHAGVFRAKLIDALRSGDAHFVVQARDAHLYHAALPSDLRDRVIPIPVRFTLEPNLDLARRFHLTATRNVLTLALLPLAASLGREVRCFGFDGRPTDQRQSFWEYDPASVLAPELALQRAAHPGFFTLDYQDYYALHCATTAAWIRGMERRGVRVRAATSSYIPALAARAMLGVAPALPLPPRAFHAAAKWAYRRRQLQALYGAALNGAHMPSWVKRVLRTSVAVSRAVTARR